MAACTDGTSTGGSSGSSVQASSGSFLLFMNHKGYRDNFSMVLKYDPEDAKSLLDEVGWKMGEGGIRVKDAQGL